VAQYSIGQVVELTGVKSHVLRYWEEVMPSFAPRKDMGGHRIYTQREIDLIRRLKYLINNKNYSIETARFQILREALSTDKDMDSLQQIHEIRQELCEYYFKVQQAKENTNERAVPKNRTEVVRKKEGCK